MYTVFIADTSNIPQNEIGNCLVVLYNMRLQTPYPRSQRNRLKAGGAAADGGSGDNSVADNSNGADHVESLETKVFLRDSRVLNLRVWGWV